MGERTFESRFETVGAARRGCPAMNAARKHLGRRIDKVRKRVNQHLLNSDNCGQARGTGAFLLYFVAKITEKFIFC
jgi:hypothetical protein